MYVASFDLNGRAIVQARVALPPVAMAAAARYRSVLGHILGTLPAVPNISAALRIVLRNHTLNQGWFFTTDKENEPALRRLVSELTRIERFAGVGVNMPGGAADFDGLVEPFPKAICRATCSGFSREEVFFSCNFRLFGALDRLLGEALVQNAPCAYQLHLTRQEITQDFARAALRNAVRMGELQGIPKPLAAAQQTLARGAIKADWLMEEFIGCETGHAPWLKQFLQRLFHEQFAGQGFDDPALAPSTEGDFQLEVDAGLHRAMFDEVPVDERCAAAVDEAGALNMLGWTPGERVATLLPPLPPEDSGGDERKPEGPSISPGPGPAAGNFRFVSYAHADLPAVQPVVQSARAAGIDLWWDHQIPGGIEWDRHLEEQIDSARAVVLFLSQRAVDSKYVRREVKYADAIGKPILAIELEPAQLRYGMGMLLNQYQRVPVRGAGLLEHIRAVG